MTLKISINNKLSNLLFSVLSGILLILIFPEFNLEFVAWIALIPLFISINKSKSFKESFFYGFISGVIFYAGILYWIVYTVHVFGNLPYYISFFTLLLLSSYLALYIGFFAGFVKILINPAIKNIRINKYFITLSFILVPSCWIFFEYLKSILLTGFPWENLGFSQYLNIPFIQISNIVGTFGLSFIIVLINFVIFHFVFYKNISKKQAAVEFLFTLSVVLLVIVYGYFNIYSIKKSLSDKKSYRVAVIQGNIGMFQKWKITKKRTTHIYLSLTKKAMHYKPYIVLWPETSLPYIISAYPEYWKKVMNFAKANKIYLIFGAIGVRFYNYKEHYYNRDYMFTKSGKYSYYDKHHLVPFGEYIPLRHQLPFLAHILKGAGIGNFTPGKKFRILNGGKIKAGSMICYEAYFDSLVRHFSKDGANLYISITDDAWYGKTAAPYQDMSMTVFSAVENDRYVARAGNSGISGIISPAGSIMAETGIFKRTFMIGNIKLINHKTFFALYGNIFVHIIIYIFIISMIIYFYFNRRKINKK